MVNCASRRGVDGGGVDGGVDGGGVDGDIAVDSS